MLDKSPEALLRGLRRGASGITGPTPRSRDRKPSNMFLNARASIFFMTDSQLRLLSKIRAACFRCRRAKFAQSLAMVNAGYGSCQTGGQIFRTSGRLRLLAKLVADGP